jgi:hypothetical protein
MAVVDYKMLLDLTILKNSILKPVRIKFLQNMVMFGLNSIIFQSGIWVGKCIISIRFANFE